MITGKFKLRSAIIFFSFCLISIGIIFNLYLIQIKYAYFFSNLGSQQYNVTLTQLPPRASIVDRTAKQYLALNKGCFSAFIMPNQIKSPELVKNFLQQYFPLANKKLQASTHKHFMYIKRKLNQPDLHHILKAGIPDIHLLHEVSRFYPIPSVGPIVGLTNIDNNGLFGIELQCNAYLAGSPETFSLEKDARSGYFYFKKETKTTGVPGTLVRLTIDGTLQFLVQEELQNTLNQFDAQEGASIIMNPQNGEILAMVCIPCFNPNEEIQGNLELTKNKIITESYELGSVIKVFAALAALEEGVVQSDEYIDCKNTKTTYIDGRRINTWKEHGTISFIDVVAQSNNIGIAIIAKRLGPKLYDHYTRMGFGKKTGISFPGEATGFINHPSKWSKQSIISLSYGYEITVSLLQLATAFSIIANNGYKVIPKLILDPSNEQTSNNSKIYSDESINTIKQILLHTAEQGTAKRTAIKGYTIMSKTGTAKLLVDGNYSDEKNIYTCAGIIQKDNYKRVIVTFIKEAKKRNKNLYAATVAAPLFERIAKKMLIHERIV